MNRERVMLITGTRKGIGRYLVDHYLQEAYQVIGCSREPMADAPAGYRHFCLDVADEPKVKHLFSAITREYGRLDALLNNAGVASMNHSLLMPVSTARKLLETNVLGTFLMSREAAKVMQRRRFGRIINFVTVAVPFKLEGEAVYVASKAGVVSLTEVMAREFAEFGITVNAVAPPMVQTDLVAGVPKAKMDKLLARQAIHRFGTPAEVATAIDFFLSPDSRMVTGQVVYLGGP